MPNLRAILSLGGVSHDAVLKAFGLRRALFRFAHGACHALPRGLTLTDSYHVSRYNTSTRRLTEAMFEDVIAGLARSLH
jgi:uracil-DNA glycosylase